MFSALTYLQIKRINSEAYKKTFEEIVRNIDRMENECIPSVTLAKQEVKFIFCFSRVITMLTIRVEKVEYFN